MPGRTQNYQFPLPLEEEYYSIDVVNETTEAIDSQLKQNMDALGALRTELEETFEREVQDGLVPLAARVAQAEADIAQVKDALFTNITGNPFTLVFSSLEGFSVTAGGYNAAQSRLEC